MILQHILHSKHLTEHSVTALETLAFCPIQSSSSDYSVLLQGNCSKTSLYKKNSCRCWIYTLKEKALICQILRAGFLGGGFLHLTRSLQNQFHHIWPNAKDRLALMKII